MGSDDERSGLPENSKLRDNSEAVGPLSGALKNQNKIASEIDDYIESVWMLVMTRWQDTNGLLSGSGGIRQVSEELTISPKRKPQPMASDVGGRLSDRTKSVALTRLKFVGKETWATLEKRFDDLTEATDGLLPRSRFWECIGMNRDSQEFAGELFDALTLRRNMIRDSINKAEMYDFWGQISDQSFDSRLQTFFDMIDKDGDGRITEDDLRKSISLSASTNKLSNILNQADKYAALIMEELDPDNLGYIMIETLEMLLLQAPRHNVRGESRNLSHKLKTIKQSGNPIRRWYEDFRFPKPYGAPAQDYKKYDVVLLVGLGIAAIPIINIVKDILDNIKANVEEENASENGSTGKPQKKKSGPTRAYLYWVTREQGSFDWFRDVMNEAAEMDKNGVIEMHTYCTSVFGKDDARSAFITMLQSLYHAKHGVDVVSGTRVMSHFGKPNLLDTYTHIALQHSGSRIGVFYCGPPVLAKELKQLAHEFSNRSTSTRFDFHIENPPSEDLQKWIRSSPSRIINSTPRLSHIDSGE